LALERRRKRRSIFCSLDYPQPTGPKPDRAWSASSVRIGGCTAVSKLKDAGQTIAYPFEARPVDVVVLGIGRVLEEMVFDELEPFAVLGVDKAVSALLVLVRSFHCAGQQPIGRTL
jgi:hypothetical protein